MARKNSNSALPLTAAAVSVVVVSGLVGYYVLGGSHPSSQPVTVPIVEQTPPPSTPRVVHPAGPRSKNADYSAPGAPQIAISEDKSPTIVNAAHSHDAEASQAGTSIPTPDTEAPQTGDTGAASSSPPPATSSPDASSSSNPSSGTPTGSADTNSGSDSIPPPPGDTAHSPSTQPSKTTTPPKSSGSNDHDFEQINGSPSHTGDAGSTAPGGILYRVQTGSFADERNARILAATLASQGFTTSTRATTEGGKTVYKVQVGAYRSHTAAAKAVSDLQHSGYPAYISSGSP